MKESFDDFSKAKKGLVFELVESKRAGVNRARILYLFCILGLLIISLIYFKSVWEHQTLWMGFFTLLLVGISSYSLGKKLLVSKPIGFLSFMEDHLSISFTNNDNTLLYTEIDKIEYCGHFPENFLPKTTETYSTYKLKIYAKRKATFTLEVRRETRPPKESNVVSSKPTLEKTLHQLNEIVSIESNIKLRTE